MNKRLEIFAKHGLVKMADGGGEGGGDGGGAPEGGEPAPEGGEPTPKGGEEPPKETAIEDLPEKWQKEIRDLRKEAGDRRTQSKAAEDSVKEMTTKIGKALGLIKDGEEGPKPEELASQLEASAKELAQSRLELAVFKTAAQHGGNPNRLTDSRSFLAKAAELDPADAEYQKKVSDLAKQAVADDGSLSAAPVASKSTPDVSGGSGEKRKPSSIESAVSGAYKS